MSKRQEKDMRNLTYLLTIIILGLFSNCNSKKSSTSRLLPEPNIIEILKYEKNEIDTLFMHEKNKSLIFIKLTEEGQAIQITTDTIPEKAITTYSILKDSIGKIVIISEFPTSESGDWFIVLTHYFDKNGKTFAFERQTNFFNSGCTEGIVYETKTEFYNSDFKKIDKAYNLVDEKNKPLKKDSCTFPYDYEYKVSSNINEFLKTNKIKTSS